MNPKQLIFLLVFLVSSCKLTEKDLPGTYLSRKNGYLRVLSFNTDHGYLYTEFKFDNWWDNREIIDSIHFMNKGAWVKSGKEVILNSEKKFSLDTNRVISILSTPTKSKDANFVFKDIYNNIIPFGDVYRYPYLKNKTDRRYVGRLTSVDAPFRNADVEVYKKDTLMFHLYYHKNWQFIETDTTRLNYIITIAPYYKPKLFANKYLLMGRNKIKIDSLVFKRVKI